MVLAKLAEALRAPAERIDPRRAFADYGLDSIVAKGFIQRLNETLSLDLPTTVIFENRSVEQLAAHIAESLQPALSAPEASVTAPSEPTALRSLSPRSPSPRSPSPR